MSAHASPIALSISGNFSFINSVMVSSLKLIPWHGVRNLSVMPFGRHRAKHKFLFVILRKSFSAWIDILFGESLFTLLCRILVLLCGECKPMFFSRLLQVLLAN